MNFKHAIVISRSVDRKDNSLVVRLSEMDKPIENVYTGAKTKWLESFKEYPAWTGLDGTSNEWWNFMGTMIAKRDPQFKTERAFSEILRNEGVSIDPSKVSVKKWCEITRSNSPGSVMVIPEGVYYKEYAVLL